ncbi:iron-containing redox enzyme family protein [Nocardia mangyaensis]|uniref:iron-containing redox enzyme family protein n=1 Tax=Nocardia mangyaensis TaxID=2213200 RepID=UPI002675A055|nr:iron-containing redox enzyme family protein [Nocardia mangyaensis]MDO3646336.1 iron-containing redox enzyme family protein [Nocardia mangyaensis]
MTSTVAARHLPRPRGELSAAVTELLTRQPGSAAPRVADADPYGEDLLLTLHTCYELHYQGFAEVDENWEWDPELLRLRRDLEQRLLDALRADVPGGDDVEAELDRLLAPTRDTDGIAGFLAEQGTPEHLREYFVHRSIYHHIEADPYAWVIPRLRGQAKAALVAVEFDEFGGGRGERVHARLFADLLAGAELEPGYLHYLDVVPAPMLALVDMMSLFGLHRGLRAASVGHFAATEITSSPASRRLAALARTLLPHPACEHFYTEHVEADAVHEQVMRRDVIAELLADEPDSAEPIVFGIQATTLLEDRFADHVLTCWRAGRSSLRHGEPITAAVAAGD